MSEVNIPNKAGEDREPGRLKVGRNSMAMKKIIFNADAKLLEGNAANRERSETYGQTYAFLRSDVVVA
jgi:hypothetical protein